MKKNDVGRPTVLTDETFLKIKEYYLDGKTYKEICEILDIPVKTFEGWKLRNYEGFKDKMIEARLERMFETSMNEIETLQTDEDSRVRLQANHLVAKAAGKKWFSDRVEHTGKDGEALRIVFDTSFTDK